MTSVKPRKYATLFILGIIALGLVSCGKQQQTEATKLDTSSSVSNENGQGTQSDNSDGSQSDATDTPESIFTASFNLASGWSEDAGSETSLHPGESIDFTFRVKNNSSEPLECPKVAIEPVTSLGLVEERLRGWGRSGSVIAETRRKTLKHLGSGVPMQVANEAYFGVSNPPKSSMGGKLNPADNQYYDSRTAALWNARDAIWLLDTTSQYDPVPTSMPVGFNHSLILSRSAKPGTDVIFTGYIIADGKKQAVGEVTVHVLNPD